MHTFRKVHIVSQSFKPLGNVSALSAEMRDVCLSKHGRGVTSIGKKEDVKATAVNVLLLFGLRYSFIIVGDTRPKPSSHRGFPSGMLYP